MPLEDEFDNFSEKMTSTGSESEVEFRGDV